MESTITICQIDTIMTPTTADELKQAIFETWESITSITTENLVYSMPRRCTSVIAARGGSTKY